MAMKFDNDDSHSNETEPIRHRAPALEKGLDILELLVAEPEPLTVSAIAQKLNRSTGELFRMIQVLDRRGFVEQAPESGGYRLSGRLFALGMVQPAVKALIEIALPHMRQLSLDIGQSCHLALHSVRQIVVVARMEPGKEEMNAFRAKAERIRKKGHGQQASEFVPGVTDISAPILRKDIAAAALTVPFLESTSPARSLKESTEYLVRAASEISSGLWSSDHRA